MQTLFQDLVHDLRAKRLWPVAAVMLLALVAIPVVFMKPADPAPTKPATANPQAAQLPGLKDLTVATATSSRGGSALDVFDRKDPFRPPAAVLSAKADEAASSATSGSTAQSGAGGQSGGGGSGGSGSGGTGGTGGGGSPDSPGSTTPAPKPSPFTYVADVKFGRSDRKLGAYKGLRRLEMLPSTKSPLLIFLGTEADGGNAVFLVDSSLRTSGEGDCEPSQTECATLTIGAGAEQEFVDENGVRYTLLIEEIRPVAVTAAASSPKARPAVGSRSPGRRFQPPLIADLMTTTKPSGSSTAADSR